MTLLIFKEYPLELFLIIVFISILVPLLATVLVILFWAFSCTLPFNTSYLRPRHCLITGGSKGLGLGIAKQLARQGSHITIAARGKEALEQAVEEIKSCLKPNSNQIVQSFQVDASDYNQCLNLLKKCHASPAKSPEWVVANAGSSIPGFIADQLPQPKDQGTIMSQMLANYITAANVSQACIDFAKQSSSLDSCEDSKESRIKVCGLERDSLQHLPDRIIVVGSVLSLMSFIGYSAYSASKYALKGLTDGLRSELIFTKCRIHLFVPANMDTPGFANENKTKPKITADIEGQASTQTAEEAAKCLIGGVLRSRYIISNDLLGELVRVVVNGACPRPNALLEVFSIPLLAAVFTIWSAFTDFQIKSFYTLKNTKKI